MRYSLHPTPTPCLLLHSSSMEDWHVCVSVEGKANSAVEPCLCGVAHLVDSGDFPSGHDQLHQRGKPCCWFAFESSLRKKSSTCQVQRPQVSGTQWLTWTAVKALWARNDGVDPGSWWHPRSPGKVHCASREPRNCSHLRNLDIYKCLPHHCPLSQSMGGPG